MTSVHLDGKKVGYLQKVRFEIQGMEESKQKISGVALGPVNASLELVGYKTLPTGDSTRIANIEGVPQMMSTRLDGNPVVAIPAEQVQGMLKDLQNNFESK